MITGLHLLDCMGVDAVELRLRSRACAIAYPPPAQQAAAAAAAAGVTRVTNLLNSNRRLVLYRRV